MKLKKTSIPIFDFRAKANKPTDVSMIYIRTYVNGKRQYLSTGVQCQRRQWSDTRWIINHPDAAELNAKIKAAVEEADSSAGIPIHTLQHGSAPFLDWMASQIEHQHLAPDTMHRHRQLHQVLENYGKIRAFRDVNARNITAFMDYLAQRKVSKAVNGRIIQQPIRQTALYTYYRRLAKWVHLAQSQDLVSGNALAGVKIPRGEYTQREHLTRAEMDQWMSATPPYPALIQARDLFTVQAGTGLSYIDLMQTDFSRIEKSGDLYTLSGTRKKTGKPFFLVILPFAKEVLDRYNNNLPQISNQKYNDHLKQVAAYAGISKKISSHVGRHTYACLCLSAGVRIEAVQRTLGHSDIKTTQIYARLVDQDVLAAFQTAIKKE